MATLLATLRGTPLVSQELCCAARVLTCSGCSSNIASVAVSLEYLHIWRPVSALPCELHCGVA